MTAKSDWLENAVLNFFLRGNPGSAVVAPTATYLALYKSNPNEDNTGSEVSGGNYARQQIDFTAPTDGVVSNPALIQFPVATATWGTITHIGVLDAATGGHLLYFGAMTPNHTVNAGGRMEFPVGSVQVTEL